jgi:hypothetical protein
MKLSYENPRRVAAVSLALFAGALPFSATANARGINKSSLCKSVEFDAPHGGPGLAEVEVFPIVKNNMFAEGTVQGKVIKGNDKGAIIHNSTDSQDIGIAGEFTLTWDESSHKTQEATIAVSVEVPGRSQLQECPDTTLHFNPNTGHVSPAYPKS